MDDLPSFLAAASPTQYHGALVELGVNTVKDFVDVDDLDLVNMGMNKIEVRRLRRKATPMVIGPSLDDPDQCTLF